MSKIEVIISVSESEINPQRTYYNEDILRLTTRTRATSTPSEPIFNAFANTGTIIISDTDLAIYNDARKGLFDKYNYTVQINLNGKPVSRHNISTRPEYNYSDKTLILQLGDSIDMLDKLTYQGYYYNEKEETAYDLFLDLMQKAFNVSDDDFALLMNGTSVDDNKNFEKIFKSKTIPYPYMPQMSYRQAFNNILSLTKCSLTLNSSGKFKLNYMLKKSDYSTEYGDIIIDATQTNSPFYPSIILGNKFDSTEIRYNNVQDVIEADVTLGSDENNEFKLDVRDKSNLVSNKTVGYIANSFREPQYSGDDIGIECWRFSYIRLDELRGKQVQQTNFKYNKYSNYNLIKILNVVKNEMKDISINVEQKTIINEGIVDVTWTTNLNSPPKIDAVFPWDEGGTGVYNTTTQIDYLEVNASQFIEKFTVSEYDNLTFYKPVSLSWNLSQENETIFNELKENTNLYETEFTGYISQDYTYSTTYGIIKYNGLDVEGDYTGKNLQAKRVRILMKPLSISLTIKGDRRVIKFEDISTIYTKNNKIENTLSLSNYGTLLQNTSSVNNSSKEAETFLDYYKNGIHTATIKVLGGIPYNYEKTALVQKTNFFEIGDVVKIKDYNNRYPLLYIDNNEETEQPIRFQIIDNEIQYEGGIAYQNLTLAELSYVPKDENTGEGGGSEGEGGEGGEEGGGEGGDTPDPENPQPPEITVTIEEKIVPISGLGELGFGDAGGITTDDGIKVELWGDINNGSVEVDDGTVQLDYGQYLLLTDTNITDTENQYIDYVKITVNGVYESNPFSEDFQIISSDGQTTTFIYYPINTEAQFSLGLNTEGTTVTITEIILGIATKTTA